MAKLKTKKAVRKRIKVTAKKKLRRRSVHQNHFRAKKSGNKIRQSRTEKPVSEINEKKLKEYLPYS
jgi:ribosomal protein L35